jgi:hypothetical protein
MFVLLIVCSKRKLTPVCPSGSVLHQQPVRIGLFFPRSSVIVRMARRSLNSTTTRLGWEIFSWLNRGNFGGRCTCFLLALGSSAGSGWNYTRRLKLFREAEEPMRMIYLPVALTTDASGSSMPTQETKAKSNSH